MNIIQKIFGIDILCGYFGEFPGKSPEFECVPLIVLHDKIGSLMPGYTIKKYWDTNDNPVLASNSDLYGPEEQEFDKIIPVLIPFPQKRLTSPRVVLNLRRSVLINQSSDINYLNENNMKEIEKFDFPELVNIIEYTKVNGSLTLVLSNMDSVRDLLHNFNHGIVEKFGYCVRYYNNERKINVSKQDSLLFHITFMNLGMCVPIYDSDKVDGVGVLCEYMNRPAGSEEYSITGRGMAMVLSNNEENVITVDGSIIGEHGLPHSEFMNIMIKTSSIQQQTKTEKASLMAEGDNVISTYATLYNTSTSSSTMYTTTNR